MVNALSIDVEDYFHVSAFSHHIARDDWMTCDQRLEASMVKVLRLLAEHDTKATFFVLGWVAERYPSIVKDIAAQGHEVASHGYAHFRVSEQTPAVFQEDIRRTKGMLEDLSAAAVRGYRAASFSITGDTTWAFDILQEEGYRYSSSIYPIRHDHYGLPDAPRFAYRADTSNSLLEIPISSLTVFGRNLPCGGGGYFRLAPYRLSRWALRRLNNRERQPCVFYFHPWELDEEQPRVPNLPLKTRFRHYLNLSKEEARLRRLLADFEWDRFDAVYQDELNELAKAAP